MRRGLVIMGIWRRLGVGAVTYPPAANPQGTRLVRTGLRPSRAYRPPLCHEIPCAKIPVIRQTSKPLSGLFGDIF